jgi:hypothetical protein
VVDDCGAAVNSGAFTVVPSNSSGIAYLQPGGDGRWLERGPSCEHRFGRHAELLCRGSDRLQTTGSLAGFIAASNVPVTGEDAIVSAASFARAPLTPGVCTPCSSAGRRVKRARKFSSAFVLQTRVQVGERETPLYAGDWRILAG